MEAAGTIRGVFLHRAPSSSAVSPPWLRLRPWKFPTKCSAKEVPDFNPLGPRLPLKSLLSLAPKAAQKYSLGGVEKESPTSKIDRIKNEALKMMISGQCDAAENHVRGLYEEEEGDPQLAYLANLALVEILIHLEKYEEALGYLDKGISIKNDGRPWLYQAIIHTMLGNQGEAKKWWEQYLEPITDGYFDTTKEIDINDI